MQQHCNASLKLDKEREMVLSESTHSCFQNETKNKISVIVEECKVKVCKTFEPIQQVFEKVCSETNLISSDDEGKLPIFKSKKDTLLRARRQYLKTTKTEFKTLNDVKVPEIIANDSLVCDSGDDNDKILIFATSHSKKMLQKMANTTIC